MERWLESVYSDGTECFVSKPQPELFDTVTIWLRVYEDAPVDYVFLRACPNGGEKLIQMERKKVINGLAYYAGDLDITENRMHYHFYLVSGEKIYFYTQKEITTYIPDHTYDFVLLADYVQPEWVKHAVFYQIFPERFCNGNTKNDVKDGEYQLNGHDTIQIKDWNQPAFPYEKGFCLDFYGGDLEGVKEKIPYLKELGVNAVYLNPIFLAPSVHKYDCIDYFHVDPHFGGDEALAELSKALHENGMKLILDISINHTGTAHRWFNRDGLFFNKKEGAYNNPDSEERKFYFFQKDNTYKCWYDVPDLPTLNYTSDELREVIYRGENSVLKKWLKPPYSIDGWRFDVADVFARNNDIQLAHEIWPEIRKSIREVKPQAYILAEDWGDCGVYMQGKEWDSPMNYYGCGRVIRSFLGEVDAFMEKNEILKNIRFKMSAEDVQARVMEHLAKIPFVFWQNQFNLFDSHDFGRLHNSDRVNPDEYRGAIMFLFTLIGAASIYYGDEAQIDGTLGTFEGCRYPMPWDKDYKDSEIYHIYQTLACLKAESKAMSLGGMKFLYAADDIVAIARFYEEETYVSILSVNNETKKIRLPIGSIGAALSSETAELFGRKPQMEQIDVHAVEVTVEAHQSYFIRF